MGNNNISESQRLEEAKLIRKKSKDLNKFLFWLSDLQYSYDIATGKKHTRMKIVSKDINNKTEVSFIDIEREQERRHILDIEDAIRFLEENSETNYNCSYYLFYAYYDKDQVEKAKYHLYNFFEKYLEEDLSKTWEQLHKEELEKKIFRVSFHHFLILFNSSHIDFYDDDVKMNILRKFLCKDYFKIHHYFWYLCKRLGLEKIENDV